MFTERPEEQKLYHGIATVATFLLQIGDVGKQFYRRSTISESQATTPDVTAGSLDSPSGDWASLADRENANSSGAINSDKVEPSSDNKGMSDNTNSSERRESDAATSTSIESCPAIPSSQSTQSISSKVGSVASSCLPDADWYITFEQFLASILTEPALVDFFEKQIDIMPSIDRYRNRRLLERSSSISVSPAFQ